MTVPATDGSVAVDTSVAVPLLVTTHAAHRLVSAWARGRSLVVSGHAVLETYSVLTRLPGDVRVDGRDAAELMRRRFGPPLVLPAEDSARLPEILAALGISGGAAYDAVVALAAVRGGCILATRDERARGTYGVVGAEVVVVG